MEQFKEFFEPEVIWCLVGLVLLLLEFVMPGLIVAFFGLGAWVVALVCLFTEISINAQLIIFIVSSVVLLLLLRRWLKGVFFGHVKSKQELTEDLKEYVGEKVIITEAILANRRGKVEFHGTNWEAEADEEIAEGSLVEIVGKDNITLKVKPVG
jgi:membrane protein implicated in regulation of membrane protease activity